MKSVYWCVCLSLLSGVYVFPRQCVCVCFSMCVCGVCIRIKMSVCPHKDVRLSDYYLCDLRPCECLQSLPVFTRIISIVPAHVSDIGLLL